MDLSAAWWSVTAGAQKRPDDRTIVQSRLLFSTSVSIRFRSAYSVRPTTPIKNGCRTFRKKNPPKPGCGSTPLELTQTRTHPGSRGRHPVRQPLPQPNKRSKTSPPSTRRPASRSGYASGWRVTAVTACPPASACFIKSCPAGPLAPRSQASWCLPPPSQVPGRSPGPSMPRARSPPSGSPAGRAGPGWPRSRCWWWPGPGTPARPAAWPNPGPRGWAAAAAARHGAAQKAAAPLNVVGHLGCLHPLAGQRQRERQT